MVITGFTWSRLLLRALLVLCVLFGASHGAEAKPSRLASLRAASQADGTVVLNFHLRSSRSSKKKTVIEVQRRGGRGRRKRFSPLFRIREVRQDFQAVDRPRDRGTYRYRARERGKKNSRSKWLAVRVNTISPKVETETPEVVAPTPTSTGGTAVQRPPSIGEIPLAPGQRDCAPGYEAEILSLVNTARATVGAGAVNVEARLLQAARMKSIYRVQFAQRSLVTHGRPYDPGHEVYDTNGRSLGWTYFFFQVGYLAGAIGENIAWGYTSPRDVVTGWLTSPLHRSNILNPSYRDLGISCVILNYNGRDIPFWTQTFGG